MFLVESDDCFFWVDFKKSTDAMLPWNSENERKYGQLATDEAVKKGYQDALSYLAGKRSIYEGGKLLELEVDLQRKDQRGSTALMWASEKGDKTITKLLLDAKANSNITNKHKHVRYTLKNLQRHRHMQRSVHSLLPAVLAAPVYYFILTFSLKDHV
eukprot:g18032.t1